MKIPKSLMGAILLGIGVQAITSCAKKEEPAVPSKEQRQGAQAAPQPAPDAEPCPACGMG